MMTTIDLLKQGTALLEQAVGECDPRREARILLAHVMNSDEMSLRLAPQREVASQQAEAFAAICARRAGGEPLQYLLGQWEFFGLPFAVGPGVLIPRPETELLVETALEKLQGNPAPAIADLCSGSGCIAVAVAKHLPGAGVTAVELSEKALPYLQKNIAANAVAVEVVQGSVLQADLLAGRIFDMILSNPPYISDEEMADLQPEVKQEPQMALWGGSDGLTFYAALPNICYPLLKAGGWLAFEIGYTQQQAVEGFLSAAGYRNIACRKDLAGLPRVVMGQK